jgi:hypothetical protein
VDTADGYDLNGEPLDGERADQLNAVHDRHNHVGDHDIDLALAASLQGFDAVVGRHHAEAGAAEYACEQTPHPFIVIYEKDRRGRSAWMRRCSHNALLATTRRGSGGERQQLEFTYVELPAD